MDIINQLIESEYEGKVRLKEAELKQQRMSLALFKKSDQLPFSLQYAGYHTDKGGAEWRPGRGGNDYADGGFFQAQRKRRTARWF